ncbi:MAG: hypothetical protein IPO88_13015 [Nannocystis sp.]|uniref:nSTAND1 domain-containing NTPase n=1 Tax=Nannocystis sp. TaxID=1962667 RepID=UPI00242865F0|nr:hypothetical protein [Nannocystis sp.]MBK9754404.1 hypothetical protein [Nannocystis sp.]
MTATSPAGSPANPYVGPRALRSGEALFGRDREVARLFDLMLAERIVLLYSPSGAGKSSLLQAGLVPRLHAEGFTVRPVVRVGMAPPSDAPAGVNRYVLSTLLSLEEDVPKDRQLDLAALAGCTLAAYLSRGSEADADEVLLIDQFEELLTVDPTAVAAKRVFFAQLGEALRDTRLWVVVAMREDFIAGLDPYRAAVPKKLHTTFRLELLGREAALLAVRGPAAAAGVTFELAAAERLVDDLRQVRVPIVDGGVELRPGPHVEPVQLQVVCRGLWAALPADDRSIGLADLAELGDVDQALARYYDAQVLAAARASGAPERALRLWLERELVTVQGLRTQVLRTPGATQGLGDAALTALIDSLVLRSETRRGMMWVELAHDRIVAPLRASNAAWMAKNLAPTSRQAALWDSRGRPESLLLATAAEAEALLAAAGEWTATERLFLEQSRIVRRREAATRRYQRTIRVLAAVVGLLVVAGLSVGIVLIRRAAAAALEEAEQEARASAEAAARAQAEQRAAEQALIRQLIAQVALYREQQPELAALLAVAASTRLADPWQRKAALLNAAVTQPQLRSRLASRPGDDGAGPAAFVQIAAAGGQLYALDRRGQVLRLGLEDRGQASLLPAGTRAGDFAADPVRERVAIVAGQAIELWEVGATTPTASFVLPADPAGLGDAPRPDARVWLEGLGFSADGRTLAVVRRRSDGPSRGFVIDVEARSIRPLTGKLPVSALALAPDGALAVAGLLAVDGSIVVFSGPTLARGVLTPGHADVGRVYLARFDPHRPRLLTAGEGGAATLWTVEGGTLSAPRPLPLGGGNVRDALFLADGKLVIATETRISVWSGEPETPWGSPITPPTRATATLAAVGADGLQVAVVSLADAPIHVFDPRRLAPWQLAAPRVPMTEGGDAAFQGVAPRVAIDRAGARVAATSFDRREGGRVTVLDVASGSSVVTAAGQGEQFMALAFADAGKLVAIDAAGAVTAWTVAGGAAQTLWKLPQRPLRVALAVDPAGLAVAAGVAFGATSVTLMAEQAVGTEPSPRTSTIAAGVPITALALDHAAERLAVATCSERIGLATCARGEVRVYAVASGAEVAGPLAVDGVHGLVFAADGRRLAGLVPGAPPVVWELADGERLALTVRRSLGEFIAADFSADGDVLLASAEADNAAVALTLWDLRSGEGLAPPLVAHNPAVGSFDPGAQRSVLLAAHSGLVVSSSFDGVLLWDIADATLTSRACTLAGRELTSAEWTRFLGRGEPQQAQCGAPLSEHRRRDAPDRRL